ncbi:MAG: hypothetical protein WC791_02280 [Candidatus Paceibacterota bacterium]|jgi:hypothetical protein
MKYKYIVIIVSVFAVIGIAVVVCTSKSFLLKKQIENINITSITKEELINQNWPFTYGEYNGYWVGPIGQYITIKKMSNTGDRSGAVVYKIETNKYGNNAFVVDAAFNSQTNKLYVLVDHSVSTDPQSGKWFIYETDIINNISKEIFSGNSIVTKTFRFASDNLSLSLMSYDVNPNIYKKSKTYFSIIDLVDPKRSVTFERPGNVEQYMSDHQSATTWHDKGLVDNIIGAYRFVGNTIELTSYYAEGTEVHDYTQISDKELWSYDRATGKLTLLETIPFKK